MDEFDQQQSKFNYALETSTALSIMGILLSISTSSLHAHAEFTYSSDGNLLNQNLLHTPQMNVWTYFYACIYRKQVSLSLVRAVSEFANYLDDVVVIVVAIRTSFFIHTMKMVTQ